MFDSCSLQEPQGRFFFPRSGTRRCRPPRAFSPSQFIQSLTNSASIQHTGKAADYSLEIIKSFPLEWFMVAAALQRYIGSLGGIGTSGQCGRCHKKNRFNHD